MSLIESEVGSGVPEQPAPAAPRSFRPVITRVITVGALIGVMAAVVYIGQVLWNEWNQLQGDLGNARGSELIGYQGIAPIASYAEGPREWYQENGDQSLLWAGWEDGVGHRWFHFAVGDIDRSRLNRPKTQFVSRPIDYPLVESDGGEIWKRIPMESTVVGHTLSGVTCVYPVTILGKVQTINDLVEDHPYLIAINLFAPPNDSVSIFDAAQDGHRLTMAASGYFFDGLPLYYDRGTESLWIENDNGLRSVAGKYRGKQLLRIAHPAPVSWKSWLAQNQRSRLVVGADRTRGIPKE